MGMKIETATSADVDADFLAVPVLAPAEELTGAAAILDTRLGGRLARLAADGEVRGTLGHAVVVHLDGELAAKRIVAVGVGPADALDADAVRTAAAAATRAATAGGTLVWLVDQSLPLPADEQARAAVEGVVLGAYDPGGWRSSPNGRRELGRLIVAGEGIADATRSAGTVAAWANRARDLANAPPNVLTPAVLAERAAEFAADLEHLEAEALGPDEIAALGMGAFGAVAAASDNPARLIVLRYTPPQPAHADLHLGLVGKAITFDSGGISIKPALFMQDMKGDMAGGAGVLAGIAAVAALGLPVRATAVVASCENLVGGGAFRPGDILTAANGKTIEVVNTDAEGRLVLADALWYARREGATHLLDVATLTGAMVLAMGDFYAGVFGNDDEWRDRVVAAGERSGDHVWPFPLHPRYRRYVKSNFADMKNASELKEGSPVLAAEFLQEFAGEGPWAHLDMSGPGYLRRSRGDYLTVEGGTGYGVRMIVELARSLSA